MKCPKCKDVSLARRDDDLPCSCLKCGGLWLEMNALSTFDELINVATSGHKKPDHDQRTGLCPEGHGILIRAKVEAAHPFYLEKCSKCGGIWFDREEWLNIPEGYCDGDLYNLWSAEWRKQLKDQQRKDELDQMYEQALGKDFYRDIVELAQSIKNHKEKYKALELFNRELVS